MEVWTIFRKFKGEVLALFPLELASFNAEECACYCRTGQHGHANYNYVVDKSVPASISEYIDLLKELENIGYVVSTKTKAPANHVCQRLQEIQKLY